MFVWVMQMLVFYQRFEMLDLLNMVSEVRVLHCWSHTNKTICYRHILLVYSLLLIPLFTQASGVYHISHLFLSLVPLRMMLVLPIINFDKLPDYVFVLL